MIYIGKVCPNIMEPPIDKSVIDFFTEYVPKKIIVPEKESEQKNIKTTWIDGFISGNMKSLVRKNENLIDRDCLILDLDDVIPSEKDLVKLIQEKLNKFSYVLYPSMSHGLKGVRYRLVIPLDKSVDETDYKLLVYFFSNKVLEGIIHHADQSNLTWSQIQLLPVFTQYIYPYQIIIHKSDHMFPTVEALKSAKKWAEGYIPDTGGVKTIHLYKSPEKYKKGGYRYRNTTTLLFESIVSGCEKGNRNNKIAQITGGLLARSVDVVSVLELVKIANNYFAEPLSEKEVEDTFYSIAKKELRDS